MVLYNGKKKHTAPRALHEIFEYPEIARKVLFEDYHLVDLSKFSNDALREKKWAGSMLFFMKHIFGADFKALLRQKSDCLKEVALKKGAEDFLSSILWYNKENIFEDEEEEIKRILVEITNQKAAKVIMGTLAEKYERSRQDGRQEGRQAGKLEAMRHVVKKMVAKGSTIEEIKDLTGLTLREVLELKNKR